MKIKTAACVTLSLYSYRPYKNPADLLINVVNKTQTLLALCLEITQNTLITFLWYKAGLLACKNPPSATPKWSLWKARSNLSYEEQML